MSAVVIGAAAAAPRQLDVQIPMAVSGNLQRSAGLHSDTTVTIQGGVAGYLYFYLAVFYTEPVVDCQIIVDRINARSKIIRGSVPQLSHRRTRMKRDNSEHTDDHRNDQQYAQQLTDFFHKPYLHDRR